MFGTILSVIQLICAVLLIAVILLQQKGSGLGAAFGGSAAVYTTRRGIDRILFQFTIVVAVLFFAVSLAIVMI